jgi:excisionase family DNA binding protein
MIEVSNEKKFLTVDELARLLGVPKSWIYDRTYRNEIPHYKLGRLLRFDLEKIQKWLENNEKGSKELTSPGFNASMPGPSIPHISTRTRGQLS